MAGDWTEKTAVTKNANRRKFLTGVIPLLARVLAETRRPHGNTGDTMAKMNSGNLWKAALEQTGKQSMRQ